MKTCEDNNMFALIETKLHLIKTRLRLFQSSELPLKLLKSMLRLLTPRYNSSKLSEIINTLKNYVETYRRSVRARQRLYVRLFKTMYTIVQIHQDYLGQISLKDLKPMLRFTKNPSCSL